MMREHESHGYRRSRAAIFGIVALFAIVILSAPTGLLIRNKVGEPYPWFFQPSFGYVLAANGTLDVETPELTAVTADGDEMKVSITDVMPKVRTNAALLFRNNFQREEVLTSQQTAAMIAASLKTSYPDKDFSELRITWTREQIDVHSGTRHAEPATTVSVIHIADSSGGNS